MLQSYIKLCLFTRCKQVVRHGFPYQPTALAFDPVQNLLAIGTKSGSIRLYPLRSSCESSVTVTNGSHMSQVMVAI